METEVKRSTGARETGQTSPQQLDVLKNLISISNILDTTVPRRQ